MRSIIFRGKRADNGEWVYGDLEYSRYNDMARIHSYDEDGLYDCQHIVNRDSVGQSTGLKDRNGKEIYEGDIVRYGEFIYHVIEFKHGMFGYMLMDGWFVGYGGNTNFTFNPLDKSKEHEIIGNIHDSPELIPNQPTEV